MPSRKVSRRNFVKTSAAAGVGFWVAGTALASDKPRSPNERIRFACIGIEGKGTEDSNDCARFGDVVAICDVDDDKLDKAIQSRFTQAKRFNDYREMLDKMGSSIDAVTVSTPDHNHAAAGLLYMRAGKHCFCQKPLTHTIYEAHLMGKVAREKGLATQMGNQGTAESSLRKSAALVRAGALGSVKEVHVWTNRPMWAQGQKRPKPAPGGPPKNLHWETWLGPAPERPFANGYHPFSWRGYWDFGTGALGDMACHTVNMPFMALDLFDPISVEAQSAPNNKEMYPNWSIIKFEFPANKTRGPLSLTWYDGGKLPRKEWFDEHADQFAADSSKSQGGCLIIGDKGKLYAPGDYAEKGRILFAGASEPQVDWVHSPGHFNEWVEAIKGGPAARSNFADYGARLTQTILLGNLAVWAGTKVEWNAEEMKATNLPELDAIVRPRYRGNYTLDA